MNQLRYMLTPEGRAEIIRAQIKDVEIALKIARDKLDAFAHEPSDASEEEIAVNEIILTENVHYLTDVLAGLEKTHRECVGYYSDGLPF